MSSPRLKAAIEAAALLRLAAREGRFAALRRRGEEEAGGILLLLRSHDGAAMILSRIRHEGGETAWLAAAPAPFAEAEAEQRLAREITRDPDLWVIEIEGSDLAPPFLGPIVR